jgi:hypothetical protein
MHVPSSFFAVLPAVALLARFAAADADLVPNSVKYGEKSPPATGRSGTAVLAVRALIDRHDQTLLEATTGELDGAAPTSGEISKLQVKPLDGAGESLGTLNDNGLSQASFSATYGYFGRGQPLQVQANIRGVDGHRTDVVTVTTAVKARPDLAVLDLTVPQKVTRNTLVNIAATVAERNGDVGARASCLLRVDGAEVDRADGIWVDAGDAVSCAFTHTFDTLGERTVQVEVADVTPWDWDDANNVASAALRVVKPEREYDYAEANFGESDFSRSTHTRNAYDNITYGNTNETWATQSGWSESGFYRGEIFGGLAFPLGVTAVVSDGTRENRATWQLARPDYTYGGGSCGVAQRTERSSERTVIMNFQTCANGPTIVYYFRYAGVVTYFSSGYNSGWYISGGQRYTNYYTFNFTSTTTQGSERLHGAAISYDVSLETPSLTFRRPLTVSMAPRDSQTRSPWRCYTMVWPWGYTSESCSEEQGWAHTMFGYVNAGTIPDEDLP